MLIRRIELILPCCALVALASTLTGCDKHAAEVAALKADNEHLKAEIANLRRKASGAKEDGAASGKPDMILTMNELWTQRFEANEYRAKQRLADKTLRVTGTLEEISGEHLSINAIGNVRSMRMAVNLERSYSGKVQDGMAALERGITITVQGKFAYDRMELNESVIVDKKSGEPLDAEKLKAFGQAGPDGAPPPAQLPENR